MMEQLSDGQETLKKKCVCKDWNREDVVDYNKSYFFFNFEQNVRNCESVQKKVLLQPNTL